MSKKIFSLLSLLVSVGYSNSADQSSTGALLRFPYVNSSNPLYNVAWEVSPSQFGFHNYGGQLEAYMVLPMNTTYHWECTREPKGANTYIHWVDDWGANSGDMPFIMLIDRGDCYFVEKVENAQAIGASAVIILDYTQEALFTMWPPEDWDDDIHIPSVLLQYNNAATLMQQLGVQNWNPNSVTKTSYPFPTNMSWTVARLEWGLPHPDDRVEYEIWTSANDLGSVDFKKNWRDTALNFDYNNYTIFTPHVYILNGSHWNCNDGSLRCSTQCTNNGRYCAVDPEYDLSIGITGMAVVQENLRSICIWKYTNTTNQSLWWDYSSLWNDNCWLAKVENFTDTCSYAQMARLDPNLPTWVKNCITASGGYDYRGGVNTILDAETRIRESNYIYNLPTILVNAAIVHGNIDCAQITEQTCQVLDAICAGFLNGTAPPQCAQVPVVNCSQSDRDCRGVCYGQFRVDRCGQCLSNDTNPNWDNCVGCDGVPNSGKKVNPCGYCMSASQSDWSTYGKDCRGVCLGGYVVDSCGQCISPSSDDYNYCKYNNTSSGGGDGKTDTSSDDGKADTSLTLVIIISVIAFLVILLCAGIAYKLWKRQQSVEHRFSSIVKQYQLMDNQGTLNTTRAQPIPSDEPDD